MAEDITVKVVTETKGLQEKINSSSLSKEDKSVLSAKLSEALNLLSKGANASARDLSIASGNIRKIIDELVKASAGAKGVSKELIQAQKSLEEATKARDALRKERSNIIKTKINNEGKLRTSEANRLATAANVTNNRGEAIKSYQALVNAADKGNVAAKQALENITRTFESYQTRLNELNTTAIPNADQAVKTAAEQVAKVEQDLPETSASVQMQEFGNELQNLIDKLKQMQSEAPDNDSDGNKPNDVGVDPGDDLKKLGQNTTQASNSLGKAFKQFSIYNLILKNIKIAAREAVKTIKELDSSLTEQAMVTGKTREQTYALLSDYQELATQTGATTKEIANLTTQFMRQGKTTEDALVLTQAAMSAAKVAGISATDSVNYLTTALNGFQLSAEDAITVSDKFAAVAASAATSYDEIATALSKVASQANLAGMSIDYTTALLTKGLETTREAPETIGTALKTVIARMRELSDYGETLGGDTDINNVESQLAYVGIALRDNNGELRSTQDVLDELGKKWDTLNSNQQAAVAKALAGTRQQSRLIAMMSDYERVIELQQISERSAGATLAQMETYLEGMDAALNKINIAWEKIVTSLTDNQVIINMINGAANLLDWIGSLLENEVVTIGLIITVSGMALISLTKKLEIQKAINRAATEERKSKIKQQILDKKAYLDTLTKAKGQNAITKELITQQLIQKGYNAAEATAMAQKLSMDQQDSWINAEILKTQSEINTLQLEQVDASIQLQQNAAGFSSLLGNALSILTPMISLMAVISTMQSAINAKKAASIALSKQETKEETKGLLPKVSGMFAKIVSAFSSAGIPGVIAGIALATGLAAALGVGIAASMGAFNGGSEASKTADEINQLSNEIYKLETKARSLDNIADSYDKIDKQIIKSKKDQEELNELIDQAADKMTDEEKAVLNSKRTNKEKIDYIRITQAKADEEAKKNRDKQLVLINSLKGSQLQDFLDPNSSNSEILTAQAAIYANNNSYLYDYIDGLGDVKDGVEEVAQALLEELTPAEALAFANQPEQIEELVNQLNSLNKAYTSLSDKDKTGTVTEVLTSDDYSIVDKVDAYRQAIAALTPEMQELFNATYADIATFATFSESILSFIDTKGITVNGINDIGDAINELGYTGEAATQKLQALFATIADGTSIQDAITTVFGLDLSSETGITQYNAVLKAYTDAIGTGILNMGQNIQSLKTNINSFYETAMKWSELTDSEKTAFLTDNMQLFEGPEGQKLLKAIESQDYNLIYQALSDKDGTLYKKVQKQIQDIDEEIQLEYAKLEADRNYAYIQYLEDQKRVLQDSTNLYAASLETRLEQEEKFLEEYKSYREKERDALKESLEKRKEAYSDYFEEINQEAEDEDFEEQENTLITNISKLAASTSANAINQQAELQKQLENLEKERIAELRQRAQDAIVENISDTIDDIDKKFDELLNSQQALLQAMNGDLNNPNELLSKLIGTKLMTEGLTNLQLSSYVQELQATYGSLNQFAGVDWSALGQVLNTLNLNVNGTTINNLTTEQQQSIYEAIQAALRQIGLN